MRKCMEDFRKQPWPYLEALKRSVLGFENFELEMEGL